MSSPLAGRLASSPHTPSTRGEASVQPAVTPGSFSTHSYLPASTSDALEARRAAFFQRQPSSSTPSSSTPSSSAPRPPRRPPSSYLRPGPAPAATTAASPQDRSRAFKRPPSALFSGSASASRSSPSRRLLDGGSEAGGSPSNDDADNVSSRLYRQRFQQRCQAAIAREKGRQKAIARVRGRDVLSSPTSADDGDAHMPLNSDDLSSSDVDDDGMGDAWQYEDDELVRRVMLAEYRRLLTKQESSGRHELGWLGADEVAWLEEELARNDEAQEEPPADMVDEESALEEQFDHAFAQAGSEEGMEGEGEWDEDTLRAIEEMESAQQQQGDVEMDMA